MPFLDDSNAATSLTSDTSDAMPTLQQTQSAAATAIPTDTGSPFVNTVGMAALAPVDLLDTVASNKFLQPVTGVQRGSINNAMLSAIGQPGLTDFYNQHQQGIETMSGIGGLVAADLLTKKFTAPAGAFMGALRTLPYVRRIATLDDEYSAAMGTVNAADTALAARGATGMEAYAGQVTVDGMKFDSTTGLFSSKSMLVARGGAVFQAKGLGALIGVRNAAFTEATAYAALNSNGFLYSDDAAQNLVNQALGLTLGAGAEWFHSAYQIRKAVNTDEMKRAFQSALDPTGQEESRLLWNKAQVDPKAPEEGFLGGSYTDQITSLMTSTTNLKELPVGSTDDGRSLLANRDSLATQYEALANDYAQKLVTKGITTDGRSRFSMDTPELGNHVAQILHNNASDLYGVEMLGGIPDDIGGGQAFHEAHMARVNERINQTEAQLADPATTPADSAKLTSIRGRLQYESELTPISFVDGERGSLSNLAGIEGFQEPKIAFTPSSNAPLPNEAKGLFSAPGSKPGLFEAITPGSDAAPVSLDTDMTLYIPGNKDLFTTADQFDVMRAYRLGNQVAENLKNWTAPITLPANPTAFQLDMAENILKKNPSANIIWPEGMTRDSAQVESMAQKAEALPYWQSQMQANASDPTADARGLDPESMMTKLRLRLNLPKLSAYEQGLTGQTEAPTDALLRGISAFGPDAVRQMPLQDLKQSAAEFKRLGDLTPVTAKDISSLSGNSFTFGLDDSGKPTKPLIGYARTILPAQYTPDAVTDSLAARQMARMGILTGPDAAPLTSNLTTSLLQNPDMETAMATHGLMDQQIQGNVTGSAPQSFLGAIRNDVASSDWIARDNPVLLAASRVQDGFTRVAKDSMKAIMDGAFGGNLNQLKNPRNASSKLLLDQFHSYAGGWDLDTKELTRPDGFNAFGLSDTVKNQQRWAGENGGAAMPKGQTLVTPQGKEVVLDGIGLDLQNRFNQVSNQLLDEKNTVLRAQGMSQIEKKNWYVPPPSTKGKYIGFTIGPDGKAVPGMGVVADSPAQFQAMKAQLKPLLDERGMGFTFHTQDEIQNFASIYDRAQMDFIDPGTTAVQAGKTSKGALLGPGINMNGFEDSLGSLRDGYLSHANDILETIFKPQLDASKARAAMSTSPVKNRFLGDIKYNSIQDIYQQNLLGTSKLQSAGSVVGKLYNPIEGFINEALTATTGPAKAMGDSLSNIWDATNGWINRANPWTDSSLAKSDFSTLADKLGPHMPFDSAAQMMEQDGLGARPWTASAIGAGFNRFAAAAILRFCEVAQPIIHLSTIVNSMPAVIRHFTQMEGESLEDYATRIGHSATIFHLPDGSAVGIPDMAKMGASGIRRAWQASSEPDFNYMVQRGYISNEVAEFHKQFGAIDSKSSWERFFGGDESIGKPQNLKDALIKKGLVGSLSTLTDWSYDFTRSWGHMTGLELADHLGVQGISARNDFAHDVANKMIANYSPHNRPAIFQGAMGSSIGLFQSFMQEYYQRMFRYIETKDYKSLVTQYVMQGSIFGVNSVPGFSEYNKFMANIGNKEDPRSNLQQRLGQHAGDLIQNGVLSNIPTLFGQPGVALYSRGDTTVSIPGFNEPPALAILGKVAGGIGQAIQLFKNAQAGTLSRTQLTEVVANAMPNRPIAGMIQQWGDHGDQVDADGQLVSDTKGALEAAYRLVGIRSQRQQDEVNAFYANKNSMTQKASQDTILRLATRAAMRQGDSDALPAIYSKYMQNGGDPRQFQKWMKENYQAATTTRGQRQLDNALKGLSKNPANAEQLNEMVRLMDSGVSVNQDENTPDPSATYGAADQGDSLNQPTTGIGNYEGQMSVQPPPAQAAAMPGSMPTP